jgi:hypothetical protein
VADQRRDTNIRERLAAARSPDEVARILGRRRLVGYPLGFCLIAAALGYELAEILTDTSSAWTLLLLPAFLFIVLFFGYLGAVGLYFAATGRRLPKAEKFDRLFARLNSRI